MKWVSHPSKENRRRTTVLVLLLVVVFVGSYILFQLWGLVLGIILIGNAISPYFVATRYEFNDESIVIKGLLTEQKRRWKEFRSFYPDKNGVFLSVFSTPRRLENFRGIYIRFGDKRDEVMEYVRKKVERPEGVERKA